MKNGIWSNIQKFFPFIGLATILIVFSFLSGGRLWQLQNLQSVLNTMIPICLGGGGMIFVSAQGSTNMSMGSTLALSGAIAGLVSNALGFWSFVPTALLVGLVVGIFNGVMVSKFKVSSLMVTLSMLIACALWVTLLTSGQPIFVDFAILNFNNLPVKLPIFLGAMVILWYMFEHTKLGHFSAAWAKMRWSAASPASRWTATRSSPSRFPACSPASWACSRWPTSRRFPDDGQLLRDAGDDRHVRGRHPGARRARRARSTSSSSAP